MISSVYIIFRPIDKWGNDDVTRNIAIYDSGYVKTIELIKRGRRTWTYVVTFDSGAKSFLSAKTFRFTLGVNKDE